MYISNIYKHQENMVKQKQQIIVNQARTWIGTKFHHQGRLKKSKIQSGGVDCIGLLVGIIDELKIENKHRLILSKYDETNYSALPDGKKLQNAMDKHFDIISTESLQPSDILLIRFHDNPQHIAIVSDHPSGELGMIHCYSASGKVVEHILTDKWQRMIVKAYRFKSEHLNSIK